MKNIVQTLVNTQHSSIAGLFKSYGVNKPVTTENLAQALAIHGMPFLIDLDELIAYPMCKHLASASESEISSFLGDDLAEFGGKFKARKQARQASGGGKMKLRKQGRQASGGGKMKLRREERSLKKESKRYSTVDRGNRRKGLGTSIFSAAQELGANILTDFQDGTFNPIHTLLDSASAAINGHEQYTETMAQDNGDYDTEDQGGDIETTKKIRKPEAEQNNTLLYVGIAAALLVLVSVIMIKGKK